VLRPGGLAVFQFPSHIPAIFRLQWRRRRYMEGNNSDELVQRWIALEAVKIDPAEGAEDTQPEIALPFARTDEGTACL
jgi:hypothetical protein